MSDVTEMKYLFKRAARLITDKINALCGIKNTVVKHTE